MGVVGVKGGAGWVDDDGGDDRSCLYVSLFFLRDAVVAGSKLDEQMAANFDAG